MAMSRLVPLLEFTPLYRGFQNCLKPFIAVYKANIEAVPALQLQDDMALCYPDFLNSTQKCAIFREESPAEALK